MVKSNIMDGACSTDGSKRYTRLKESDYREDIGIDGRIILKWISGECVRRVWFAFVWLRVGTSGWLLWKRQWTFWIHESGKILGKRSVLIASQGLCSMALARYTYLSPSKAANGVMELRTASPQTWRQESGRTPNSSVVWCCLFVYQRIFDSRLHINLEKRKLRLR